MQRFFTSFADFYSWYNYVCRICRTNFKHLEKCDSIFCHFQIRSCATNLFETVYFFTENIYLKNPVDVVHLYFAKPFDKVSNSWLIYKCSKYEFDDKLFSWIISFLTNRSQRVISGEAVSNWKHVKSCVA